MNREIFKFNDGAQDRCIDPIEAEREIIVALHPECGGDLFETCSMARTHDDQGQRVRPDAQAFKYRGYLIDAFRQVLKLPKFNPMNQEGVLEDEVWRVMDEFFSFRSKKKESTGPSPMSAEPLEFPGQSPTTNITGSGSTPNAA